MVRRTQRKGGNSKSRSLKSRSSPKGIPMPEYEVQRLVNVEKKFNKDIMNMPEDKIEELAKYRTVFLEGLKFDRGKNDWSRISNWLIAYDQSLKK